MEIHSIREWAPLTSITEQIPERILKGLYYSNVNITCIDATEEFLALGSDAGIVFWYNRQSSALQKLKTEVTTRITSVKIVNSVEFIVAAGNSNGQVFAFQIPKDLHPDLDLVAPFTKPKPIHRYIIRDLHDCRVTCCEWSKNGMKLYTGDAKGVVVLTEFDYAVHLSKSVEIFKESFEIVQLSVYKVYLLICTLYRSIVCKRDPQSGEWHLTQVGKKDRKQLMDCGGCFLKCNIAQQPKVICGRPGLRFWMADVDGNVERTLLFRDALARSPAWSIPILNPKFANIRVLSSFAANNEQPTTQNFQNLYLYNDTESMVVTHDGSTLYILDLEGLSVEAVATGFRNILDLCVVRNEIFILEGNRSLMRIAPMPEKPNKSAMIIFNPAMPPPVPLLGMAAPNAIESPTAIEPNIDPIPSAEECLELPPIEELNLNVPIELAIESPRAEQNRRLELFKRISELDFDQSILHHSDQHKTPSHKKRRNRSKSGTSRTNGIVEIGHIAVGNCNDKDVVDAIQSNVNIETSAFDYDRRSSQNLMPITDDPHKVPVKENVNDDVIKNIPNIEVTEPTSTSVNFSFELLSQAYPKQVNVENAGVQTSPHKKYSSAHGMAWVDYSGQPFDNECLGVHLTEASNNKLLANQNSSSKEDKGEIESFLLDFRRAENPLRKPYDSPVPDESITSSEWEFLDN